MSDPLENERVDAQPDRGSINGLTSFDQSEIKTGLTFAEGAYLLVQGVIPPGAADVRLVPQFGGDPDFRPIAVVAIPDSDGSLNDGDGDIAHTERRFEKSMPLSGLIGKLGIELVGADSSKRFNLADDTPA